MKTFKRNSYGVTLGAAIALVLSNILLSGNLAAASEPSYDELLAVPGDSVVYILKETQSKADEFRVFKGTNYETIKDASQSALKAVSGSKEMKKRLKAVLEFKDRYDRNMKSNLEHLTLSEFADVPAAVSGNGINFAAFDDLSVVEACNKVRVTFRTSCPGLSAESRFQYENSGLAAGDSISEEDEIVRELKYSICSRHAYVPEKGFQDKGAVFFQPWRRPDGKTLVKLSSSQARVYQASGVVEELKNSIKSKLDEFNSKFEGECKWLKDEAPRRNRNELEKFHREIKGLGSDSQIDDSTKQLIEELGTRNGTDSMERAI